MLEVGMNTQENHMDTILIWVVVEYQEHDGLIGVRQRIVVVIFR